MAMSPAFEENAGSINHNYPRNTEANMEVWRTFLIKKKERCREQVGECETVKSGDASLTIKSGPLTNDRLDKAFPSFRQKTHISARSGMGVGFVGFG
jgi:hypothetical protein